MRKKATWLLVIAVAAVVAGGLWTGGRLLWDAVRRLHGQ
jgi:hypothetical protein